MTMNKVLVASYIYDKLLVPCSKIAVFWAVSWEINRVVSCETK